MVCILYILPSEMLLVHQLCWKSFHIRGLRCETTWCENRIFVCTYKKIKARSIAKSCYFCFYIVIARACNLWIELLVFWTPLKFSFLWSTVHKVSENVCYMSLCCFCPQSMYIIYQSTIVDIWLAWAMSIMNFIIDEIVN